MIPRAPQRCCAPHWRRGPVRRFPIWRTAPTHPPEVAGLEEERLVALEDRIEADINSGAGSEAVAELERLVAEHPLRERFHAHRIVALYRAGRQADALEAYRRARTVLREELGIDPGPALQRLERAVLEQDPLLLSVVPVVRSLPTLPVTPNPIIGRQAELADIMTLLKEEGGVRLVTLIGPGGARERRGWRSRWQGPCNRTSQRACSLWLSER